MATSGAPAWRQQSAPRVAPRACARIRATLSKATMASTARATPSPSPHLGSRSTHGAAASAEGHGREHRATLREAPRASLAGCPSRARRLPPRARGGVRRLRACAPHPSTVRKPVRIGRRVARGRDQIMGCVTRTQTDGAATRARDACARRDETCLDDPSLTPPHAPELTHAALHAIEGSPLPGGDRGANRSTPCEGETARRRGPAPAAERVRAPATLPRGERVDGLLPLVLSVATERAHLVVEIRAPLDQMTDPAPPHAIEHPTANSHLAEHSEPEKTN